MTYHAYIRLPGKGAIWIERRTEAVTPVFKPEAVKENGEVLIWWSRWHMILTIPGWKAQATAKASLATA